MFQNDESVKKFFYFLLHLNLNFTFEANHVLRSMLLRNFIMYTNIAYHFS